MLLQDYRHSCRSARGRSVRQRFAALAVSKVCRETLWGSLAFEWPDQHHDPLSTGTAILFALLMTSGAATALAFSLVPMRSAVQAEAPSATARRHETVVFSVPVPRETTERASRPLRRSGLLAPVGVPTGVEQIPALESTADTLSADSDTTKVTSRPGLAPVPLRPSPIQPAAPLLPPPLASFGRRSLTAAERDSVWAENVRRPVGKLNGWRIVSEDEKAGFRNEIEERIEKTRLEAVPADVAGKPGFTTGWLSSGPSREQRRRDSIIHRANAERLAKLVARAKAKRDSVSALTPPLFW